jgi:hypothetical protein
MRIDVGHHHRHAPANRTEQHRQPEAVAVRYPARIDAEKKLEHRRQRDQDADLEGPRAKMDGEQRKHHPAAAQTDAVQDAQQGNDINRHGGGETAKRLLYTIRLSHYRSMGMKPKGLR